MSNIRGHGILKIFTSLTIDIANKKETNTYLKAGMGSILDIPFTNCSLPPKTRWYVSEKKKKLSHITFPIVLNSILEVSLPQSSNNMIEAAGAANPGTYLASQKMNCV